MKKDAFGSANFNFQRDMSALDKLRRQRHKRPVAVSPVHKAVYQEAKAADPSFLEEVTGAAKSFGRGVVFVSTLFGLSKAGAIIGEKAIEGHKEVKEIGDYFGLPGLKMTGFDFEYSPVGVAYAAEETSDNWGEWKYLMEGKPTDSWGAIISREATYFYKILTDGNFRQFVAKMKSGDPITAYAIATGKPLEGKTEEQKKAIACADPIYAAGADECKTISAENPKNELGAAPNNESGGLQGSVSGLDGSTQIDLDKLQVHYSAAKGELKGDVLDSFYMGSAGAGNDDLLIVLGMKQGVPDSEWIRVTINQGFYYWDVDVGVGEQARTQYHDGALTKPEKLSNEVQYSFSNGQHTVLIKGLYRDLKEKLPESTAISLWGKDGDDFGFEKTAVYDRLFKPQ